jgi:2-phospho-L-lactate guanylyltransferase
MRTVAILPIKSFSAAKQRLDGYLTAGVRRALAESMFSDVLVALRRATTVVDVVVVTSDNGAQQIAAGYGLNVLDDDDQGHNIAAGRGVAWALERGYERVLLVPGDCPALDPIELDALIARPASHPSALIVPDRHGTGTNALLLTPPDSMEPSFGEGSRARHVANAVLAGITADVVEVPTLALDIDTEDDLAALGERLATTHGRAAHTRGMLSRLARSIV